jgi:hypothetical protein
MKVKLFGLIAWTTAVLGRPYFTSFLATLGLICTAAASLASSTYDFVYDGFDQTGTGITITDSGSFTYPGTGTTANLSQLTQFTFTQTSTGTVSPGIIGSSTYTYSRDNLINFSFDGTALTLQTTAARGDNAQLAPETFNVTAGTGQTFNAKFGNLLTQGTVAVLPTPATVAAQFYNNVVVPSYSKLASAPLPLILGSAAVSTAGFLASVELLGPAGSIVGTKLFYQEAEVISFADQVSNLPSNLDPLPDPPFTLPPLSPSGAVTADILGNFTQLEQNLAQQIALVGTLKQL